MSSFPNAVPLLKDVKLRGFFDGSNARGNLTSSCPFRWDFCDSLLKGFRPILPEPEVEGVRARISRLKDASAVSVEPWYPYDPVLRRGHPRAELRRGDEIWCALWSHINAAMLSLLWSGSRHCVSTPRRNGAACLHLCLYLGSPPPLRPHPLPLFPDLPSRISNPGSLFQPQKNRLIIKRKQRFSVSDAKFSKLSVLPFCSIEDFGVPGI